VVINSSGLYGYDSGGTQTISINASTGAVTIGAIAGTDLIGTAQVNGNVTSISGGVITTGTIAAARLDLSGVLTAGSVGAGGSTTIDGGRITSGTITGVKFQTAASGSRIIIADSGSDLDKIDFYADGTRYGRIYASPNALVLDVAATSEVRCSGPLKVNSTSTFDAAMTTKGISATGDISCTGDMTVGDELFADRISTEADFIPFNGYRTTNTAADTLLRLRSNVTNNAEYKFEVFADGDVQSRTNSYAGYSDARLKENVEPARQYLSDLRDVDVVTFNWIGDPYKLLGVTAQQIQPIFPSMVQEDEDGTLSVRYSVFVPMLITAVQELADKVDDLTARIEALEG